MPIKLWIVFFLSAAFCGIPTRTLAQTDSFPDLGRIGPSKAEVVGIIVGAAAVIGVVVYLVIPKQKTIEGCVESSDQGLQFTDDRSKRTCTLATGNVSLQPGKRFRLRGKRNKKMSGTREFEVRKLVKEEGTCGKQPNGASLRSFPVLAQSAANKTRS